MTTARHSSPAERDHLGREILDERRLFNHASGSATGANGRDRAIAGRPGYAGCGPYGADREIQLHSGFHEGRPGATPDAPPPAPSVFTAVEKELGLRLAAAKLPVDVVVVESFNKTPGEN
jgi:hypothetical protein